MRLVLTSAACFGLAVFSSSVPLLAQLQDNSEKQLSCNNGGYDRGRARHCEMREQSLPSIGKLSVDSSPNGGVTIKGWSRGDVLVRARVEASGENEGAASITTSRVLIDGSGGQVRATGPEQTDNSNWSVSYEVFVPQTSDITLKTVNGGLSLSDIRGQIQFESINGGVHLKRVAGEIKGSTVNGGIDVEVTGAMADWRQMDLKTNNGGVTVAVPANYSARVQAETGMGRIQSDFPLPPAPNAEERSRRVEFNVGSGGPPLHITTGNGGIRLKNSDSK